MTIPPVWQAVIDQSRELDPILREALRPVFERLKSDAPTTAAAMSLAMICRALRMLDTADGDDPQPYREGICQIALAEVAARLDHP